MACVLHITGSFSTGELVELLKIEPYQRFEKGSRSAVRGSLYDSTTCSFYTSMADFYHLHQQIEETGDFLERNFENLQQATKFIIEESVLDFGYYTNPIDPKFNTQSYLFPAKLLRLAGNLGINIILSHYSLPAGEKPGEQK